MKTFVITFLLGTSILLGGLLGYQSPIEAAAKSPMETTQANKKMVEVFWNSVFNQKNMNVADQYIGEIYIQHNPGFQDGPTAFKAGIKGYFVQFPQSSAEIKHIFAENDYVFIHNHVKLNPADRGQAAVDIFRVKDGKIVEHWDVLQEIPEKAENNNTMF